MIINMKQKLYNVENYLEKSKTLFKNPHLDGMKLQQVGNEASPNNVHRPVSRNSNIRNYEKKCTNNDTCVL